jgi:hypothetical protein
LPLATVNPSTEILVRTIRKVDGIYMVGGEEPRQSMATDAAEGHFPPTFAIVENSKCQQRD